MWTEVSFAEMCCPVLHCQDIAGCEVVEGHVQACGALLWLNLSFRRAGTQAAFVLDFDGCIKLIYTSFLLSGNEFVTPASLALSMVHSTTACPGVYQGSPLYEGL